MTNEVDGRRYKSDRYEDRESMRKRVRTDYGTDNGEQRIRDGEKENGRGRILASSPWMSGMYFMQFQVDMGV